ncbi:MAG: VOC family protein [Candidatus Dormiibacterota bacterium]
MSAEQGRTDPTTSAAAAEGSPVPFFRGRPVGQVGIVVRDLDRALDHYARLWGVGRWSLYTYGTHVLTSTTFRGRGEPYAMRLALNSERPQVELIESTLGPNLYEEWLTAHGEGIHHLGYFVESIAESVQGMERAGYPAVQTGLGTGLDGDGGYAYFDLRAELGVYVEAIEPPARRRPPERVVG